MLFSFPGGKLRGIFSIEPHVVVDVNLETGLCTHVARTSSEKFLHRQITSKMLGPLRRVRGSQDLPGVKLESIVNPVYDKSQGTFIGAVKAFVPRRRGQKNSPDERIFLYTFDAQEPYAITCMSSKPLSLLPAENFVHKSYNSRTGQMTRLMPAKV